MDPACGEALFLLAAETVVECTAATQRQSLVSAQYLYGPLQEGCDKGRSAVGQGFIAAADSLQQAELQGFCGGNAPRFEQGLQRTGRAKYGQQIDAATPGRRDIELCLQKAEFSLCARDAQIAGHRQFGATTQRMPVEYGDDRYRKLADLIERSTCTARHRQRVSFAAHRFELTQIAAGREATLAAGRQYRAFQRGISGMLRKGAADPVQQFQ